MKKKLLNLHLRVLDIQFLHLVHKNRRKTQQGFLSLFASSIMCLWAVVAHGKTKNQVTKSFFECPQNVFLLLIYFLEILHLLSKVAINVSNFWKACTEYF